MPFLGRVIPLAAIWAAFVLGSSQSPPKVESARSLPFTPPRKWALVIGANEYSTLGPLTYAASDAKSIAQALRERFSFSPESIELITDAPESTQRPDVATIRRTLDRLLADRRLANGDLFVFYFSGHGIGTASGDYLMPANATRETAEQVGLSVKEIVRKFVVAGMRNVLFIVDACRGGEKNSFGDDLRKLGRESNIAVFLSCEPGARSYEYPQFGHGAFTNFLLKALRSKDLPSPLSGALWASKIIEQVRSEVRDYTERDYPLRPQVPTGWSEKTMDVLLGAFPDRSQARVRASDLESEAKALDREKYADVLSLFGSEVFIQHRYADAVEIWRTLDGIRRLAPLDRMNLGFALNFMGRTLEADNELAKLRRADPTNVYTWIARVYDPSRKVTPLERVAAARNIWGLTKADWAGYIVWAALQTYASDSDANAFLSEYLKSNGVAPKLRAFFEGQRLANVGQWGAALLQWEKAKTVPGEFPSHSALEASKFQCLVMLGRTSELRDFLMSKANDPNLKTANWALLLAALHKEQGRLEESVAAIRLALERELDDGDLLWAIRLAGLRIGVVAEAVAKRAEEFPFSWKAMLAKTWATQLANGADAISASLAEASKFCDDEFAVFYECLRFLDETLDETFEQGRIDRGKYSLLMVTYSALMATEIEKFGYDGETWILFNKFALLSEKFEQLLKLYDVYLGPRLADGTLDPNLRGPYLLAALAMGDRAKVEKLWSMGGFHPSDRIDVGWLRAMSEALDGELSNAKAMIPKQPPSTTFGAGAEAFQAYLRVREGGKPNLEAIGKRFPSDDAAQQFIGLAYACQKRWEKAMPILRKMAFQRQLGYIFLQAKVVETLFQRLRSERKHAEADRLAFQVMISGYGNPVYRRIHFGPKVGLPRFQGTTNFELAEMDIPPSIEKGTLKLTIDAKGKVAGGAKLGSRSIRIAGDVDPYGNLRAKAVEAGKSWSVTGKVPPPVHYRGMPEFQSSAQAFLLMDAKGQARYWIARPKVGLAGKLAQARAGLGP